MPVSPRTVDFLRRKGHDAIHLREKGMQKATDEEVIKLAGIEGRVILTMDLDFPHLIALGRLPLPSTILFRLEDERSDNVNSLLEKYLQEIEKSLAAGAIVLFEENRVRIHNLPI